MERLLTKGVNRMIGSLPGDFIPGSDTFEATKVAISICGDRISSRRISSACAIQGDFCGSQQALTDFAERRKQKFDESAKKGINFVESLTFIDSWLGPGLGESIRCCLLDKKIFDLERSRVDMPNLREI
ncbi:MAG: hypothetical protein KIH89_000845 [Candidatus Shapirobacteria bacterium]|nr:hypothetical protein [Candidatus Shapirobacteria bacterium]